MIILLVDSSLYDEDNVFLAAHAMTDKAYIKIDKDKNNFIVSIKPKKDEDNIEDEFNNKLINFKAYLGKENKGIETEALEEEIIDDPEGIAIPWEEKYGKDNVE